MQPTPQKAFPYGQLKKLQKARAESFEIYAANDKNKSLTRGYRNKEDITTLPIGVMVVGSQNVVTNTMGTIGVRQGYELDGQNNTTIAPILSSFDWETHSNTLRNLRAGGIVTGTDGFMQVRYVANAGDSYNGTTYTSGHVVWLPILSNLSSVRFNFAPVYNTSYQQQYLLMVNGGLNYYEWSGGVGTIASSTYASGVATAINVNTGASGGSGYKVGDILTVTGGGGTGLTAQVATLTNGQIATVSVYNAGGKPAATKNNPNPNGYLVGDVLTLQGGGGNATVTVTTVNGSGGITGVSVLWGGFNYTAGAIAAVSGGSGGINAYIQIGTVNQNAVYGVGLLTPGSGYSSTAGAATTGGTGTGATININTVVQGYIQLTGATTATQQNFYLYGGNVVINGNTYGYSLAVNGYLAGLTANPTGEPFQSVVLQTPQVIPNTAVTGLPIYNYSNDLISVLKNQVYIGSLTNNSVYISQTTSYTNFSFTATGRLPGEGAVLTLDVNPVAFQPQESDMYITGGNDVWYQTEFTLSADLKSESLTVQRLNTTAGQAAQSQALTTKVKNDVAFVSNEPILNTFGRVDNVVLTPQMTALSNAIVNDFANYDFTDGQTAYWQNFIIVTVPKSGLILIYNMTDSKNQYWECPQTIPISRISIINGKLYGHSYQSPVTFQLFTGYNDNGHPIPAAIYFPYDQYGTRVAKKNFNAFYIEGYNSTNSTLNLGINYEINGIGGQLTFPISGVDGQIVENVNSDNSLGKFSFGKASIGGDISINPSQLPPKFRVIKTFPATNFYEYQPFFYSNGKDFNWSIVAFGPKINESTDLAVEITE